MSVKIQTTVELNEEESLTALVRHRSQVCAVDEHLRHHEQSVRAVGDHLLCSNPLFCDQVHLESKKKSR